MIRIYGRDGAVQEVDAPLLEVASTDGLPALFVIQDEEGRIEFIDADNQKFKRLCKSLGRTPAEVFKHD